MRFFYLLITLFFIQSVYGQQAVGLKFFGLSIHPNGEAENAGLMPRKFDKKGVFVLNLGAMASYERPIIKDLLSLKVVQALYSDCAARFGGFTHLGLRATILKRSGHALYGGIGPTLVYRRNWMALDGYVNKNRFKGEAHSSMQYLFLWYGGEFEYAYTISDQLDFAATFIPGYPDLMSLSFGLKYKWNRRLPQL